MQLGHGNPFIVSARAEAAPDNVSPTALSFSTKSAHRMSADKSFRDAMASFQTGRFADAERCFKDVLRHEPKHVATLNLLSVLLTHLKRHEEAEQYIKQALALNPNSDTTLYNYGIILKAMNRPHEALERFSQALSVNPKVAETWNNRGTVLNELSRYDEALANFTKATEIKARL